MPRRRVLTEAQLNALFALPTTEADLIRHYTLSPDDMAVIAPGATHEIIQPEERACTRHSRRPACAAPAC